MTIRKKIIAIPGVLLTKNSTYNFSISDFFSLVNSGEAGQHELMHQRTNKRVNKY